jgi:hypothetical protein
MIQRAAMPTSSKNELRAVKRASGNEPASPPYEVE